MMPFDEEELDPHGECAAEIERLKTALRCAKTFVEAQPPNESQQNALAIIVGVLTSPDYVP